MSFESIWGFNPERESKGRPLSSPESEPDDSCYGVGQQLAARIPGDVDSQVYELRRMYRL